MAKKIKHAHPDKIELYDKIISVIPDLQRKGAANAYTSLNGHMFSFISKTGEIGLRLPKEELEKYNKKYDSGPLIQYDRVMREYVIVSDELLKDTKTMRKYFKISYEYISTLKPKPTKKKKK